MPEFTTVGFIGLGVMGEPICRNLVKKSGARVIAFDLSSEPLQRLRGEGAEIAASVADVVAGAEVVFLCLPSAKHVRAVFEEDGIAKTIRQGRIGQPDPRLRRPVTGQGRGLA
jgi:3-hydroxyisobutyrate dehydrogenase